MTLYSDNKCAGLEDQLLKCGRKQQDLKGTLDETAAKVCVASAWIPTATDMHLSSSEKPTALSNCVGSWRRGTKSSHVSG